MKDRQINIALVDDHRMFREGLKFLLSAHSHVQIVSESSDGEEFLNSLKSTQPDLVLMDINMPGMSGIEATEKAMSMLPDLKVIALSMFGDVEYYQKMVQAGARGFLIKENGPEELEKAIAQVMDGGSYFSQQLLQHVILHMGRQEEDRSRQPVVKLSKREHEVLSMICQGMTNAEIADSLNLSLRTVEGHRGRLISRTGVKNSIQLVLYVIRHKLVELEPLETSA